MEYPFPEHIESLRREAARLGRSFSASYWRECDRDCRFPTEFFQAIGSAGYLGVQIPEEYGGGGLGMLAMTAIVEELAVAGAGLASATIFMLTPVFGGTTLLNGGSVAQRARWLPRIARGEVACCLAMTEAAVGSDTTRIETCAESVEGGWRIRGRKTYISGAQHAGLMVLLARTTPRDAVARKTDGLTLFLANPRDPAITLSRYDTLGMRYEDNNDVTIDDLYVSDDDVVGEVGGAWNILVQTLNAERLLSAIGSIGVGRAALCRAVEYAREREVFGRPIGQNQGIAFPLADSHSKLEAARAITFLAAQMFDDGKACGEAANIAKLRGSEAGFESADRAVQTLGGLGYLRDGDVERYWRDVRLQRLAPVSQEMVLSYLATRTLGLPRSY